MCRRGRADGSGRPWRRGVRAVHVHGILRYRRSLSPEPQPPRLELLLKLTFGERVPVEACEQLIRDHREICDRDIAHLASIDSALRDTPGRHLDQPYWLMTLRYGRAVREAEQAWCDETLEHLQGTRSGHELTSESGLGR